jgi:hypothetical protein
MTDKKAQLQKAIITNDMSLVREFYEYIFSEKAPQTLVQSENPKPSFDLEKVNKAIEILKSIAIDEDLSVEETITEDVQKPASSGGMQFISSKEFELPEDSMPNYSEAMKKISKRKKSSREPYRPKMVDCGSCGRTFDFNKEYPVGQLESGANAKAKCNNCRSK